MAEKLVARQSVIIPILREQVWAVITQADHLSKWLNMPVSIEELAVGAKMVFDVGGVNGPGRIAIVEPPERFAYYWLAEMGYPIETLVTFHLEEVPGGTRVTITEEGFEALPEGMPKTRYEMNSMGWEQIAKGLPAYFETLG